MARKPNLKAREEILGAAHKLFHKRGYKGVSMDDVARGAGIKKANLFHYYPSKEKLALAVIDGTVSRMRGRVTELLERTGPHPRRAVDALFSDVLHYLENTGCCRGCFVGNFAQELSDENERLRGRIEGYFDFWTGGLASVFSAAKARGGLKGAFSPAESAEAIFSLLEGAILCCKAKKSLSPLKNARRMALAYVQVSSRSILVLAAVSSLIIGGAGA